LNQLPFSRNYFQNRELNQLSYDLLGPGVHSFDHRPPELHVWFGMIFFHLTHVFIRKHRYKHSTISFKNTVTGLITISCCDKSDIQHRRPISPFAEITSYEVSSLDWTIYWAFEVRFVACNCHCRCTLNQKPFASVLFFFLKW
jgi:hypothetical protein